MAGIEAKVANVSPSARIGVGAKILADYVFVGDESVVGGGVRITGSDVFIGAGAEIGEKVSVDADKFHLGADSTIERFCRMGGFERRAEEIAFGDDCFVGDSVSVRIPVLSVGDYTKIHNHVLISGYKPCYIGHNSWVGQNCILNSVDTLFIGNNVGAGIYSSIWTHAFRGELLEGFKIFKVAPTIIEDDVWILGAYNVVSPGVTIGAGSVVLTPSVVIENIKPEQTVSGVPAENFTDKLQAKVELSLDEKANMMEEFVQEFVNEAYPGRAVPISKGYLITPPEAEPFRILFMDEFNDGDCEDIAPVLVYTKADKSVEDHKHITIFDLSTKQYTKRRTEPEREIIKFMNVYRARFVPRGNVVIGERPD